MTEVSQFGNQQVTCEDIHGYRHNIASFPQQSFHFPTVLKTSVRRIYLKKVVEFVIVPQKIFSGVMLKK